MEKENAKKVLEKASRLKYDLSLTQRKLRPVGSASELDNMIANLGNPRMAEKLRIHKLVESQFNKIEEEVKLEVTRKMKKQREEKKTNIYSYKAKKVIDKSKDFREKETKRKLNFSKQNESMIHPDVKGRSVSFKEHIEHQKENKAPEFKFEVLEKKAQKFPLVVKNISRQNMGSYQIKHCVPRSENKPKLSSHILPSVNIRPALVVENIPGLQFIGNQRRPNTKIRVEHILEGDETKADGDSTDRSEVRSKIGDLSVTDSTTSKFEKLEQLIHLYNDEKSSQKEKISKFVTIEEFKDLEKKLLKEKVQEILTKKLEEKEKEKNAESSCGDKEEINKQDHLNSSQSTEPVMEIVELNIKSEESKSADKYSSTFESEDDIGTDTKSEKSVKSDSEEEEKSFTVPSEKSNDSESPENAEEKVAVIVRETPPPAESDYQQKMLSTIEEVTTVADTEDNEEDYSDLSSQPEVQYSSVTSDSEAASKDVTELEGSQASSSLQEREKEAEEQDLTGEEKHNKEPAVVGGQDQPSMEEGGGQDQPRRQEEREDGGHQSEEDQPRLDDVVADDQDHPTNSLSKESVFVSLPLELSNDESLPVDREEDHRDHIEIQEEDLDSLQDQHEEHIEELTPDETTHQEPLSSRNEPKIDVTLPTADEDTADNIETGMLSSDDTEEAIETDGGVPVTEDPQHLDILKLDLETGFLTPEKPESDQDDLVLRISPPLAVSLPEFEDAPGPCVDIPDIPDTTEDPSSSLQPPQTDPSCSQQEVTESDAARLSEGEIVIKVPESSEGEVSGELGDNSTSEGELVSRGEARRGRGRPRLPRPSEPLETSSSSGSSSWSEGEWRASPARMRRFINMAAAFRMIKESD